MSSLTQYTDLYQAQRQALASHSAPLLDSRREAAFEALRGKTLPRRGDEGYEKTSIEDMYAPDFGVNVNRVNIPTDVARSFRCDVPNVSTLLGVVINDTFVPTSTLQKNLPDGVTVMSLNRAAAEKPELVKRYLGSVAPGDDVSVALNDLLLQDGVFIHVSRGTEIQHPIQIVNIFNSEMPLMGIRRVVVALEEDSRAALLLCDHTQAEGVDFLASEVVEISMGRNSHLDYCTIEESSANTRRHSRLFACQEEGSELKINTTTLLNGVTRNDFTVDLKGEHAQTELSGMVTADRKMHVDNKSDVNHLAPRCHSNQLFKYLLDDEAQGAFEGGIYVSPDAPFTEGYQSNRNVVASDDARMHTKPQLLIYNDEVKCSHGATVGQLDRNALFYMQTRGIPENVARRLLMQAFMTDALDTISIEGIRSRLAMLVEKRLSGDSALCGDCGRDCHSK